MKVKVELIDYTYECGDGCCTNYGTITKVNGKQLEIENEDRATILREVLIELGYDAKVEEKYDDNFE